MDTLKKKKKKKKKKKQAKGAGVQNTVTNVYFSFEVMNILSLNVKICTRNSCTLLSNTNKDFSPLLSHVTSYYPKSLCLVLADQTSGVRKTIYFQVSYCTVFMQSVLNFADFA